MKEGCKKKEKQDLEETGRLKKKVRECEKERRKRLVSGAGRKREGRKEGRREEEIKRA